MPLTVIAERLNELGYVTAAGKPFHRIAVARIFNLFGKEPRPDVFLTGECGTCGRKFRVPWIQQKAHEEKGEPYLCYRCAKNIESQ